VSEKIYVIKDTKSILTTVESISLQIFNHINTNPNSEYIMIYKYITHSDITNSGKRNGPLEDLGKNLLYYLSLDEMLKLEKDQKIKFENAKQSNIFLPNEFYNFLEIPLLLRRDGFQEKQHNHIKINDYANTFWLWIHSNSLILNIRKKYLKNLIKKPNGQPKMFLIMTSMKA
jgi:hypothetical protein